jgi:hypothetical protein
MLKNSGLNIPNGKFELGRIVATPGALQVLKDIQLDPYKLLVRHVAGDWGDLCESDKQLNEMAVGGTDRVMSSYIVTPGTKTNPEVKIWIITEWDRSYTTILTPEEY